MTIATEAQKRRILPNEPWVESPFFEELLPEQGLTPEQEEQARFYHENGYLVLEDAVPEALLDQVRRQVEPLFDPQVEDRRKSPGRFQDAWEECPAVQQVAADPAINGLLEMLYGRRAIPFQTLNFCVGTQQRGHADSIHFNCIPARYMCGVWVALEDVSERNGTLFYYPGSHKLPDYDFNTLGLRLINTLKPGSAEAMTYQDYDRYEDFIEQLMAVHGLERVTLNARKGTALIWATGLVHGGSAIREPGSSRWSQVTHYYFDDCIYYVPIFSNLTTGDLYLKKVTDIRTGEPVTATFRGLPLPELPMSNIHKLWLDYENDQDAVKLFSNHEIRNLRGEIDHLRTTLERENEDLKEQIERLNNWHWEIAHSPSMRLGRALTAPFRTLRGLFRQKSTP